MHLASRVALDSSTTSHLKFRVVTIMDRNYGCNFIFRPVYRDLLQGTLTRVICTSRSLADCLKFIFHISSCIATTKTCKIERRSLNAHIFYRVKLYFLTETRVKHQRWWNDIHTIVSVKSHQAMAHWDIKWTIAMNNARHLWPLLLTWFNFNRSMDK